MVPFLYCKFTKSKRQQNGWIKLTEIEKRRTNGKIRMEYNGNIAYEWLSPFYNCWASQFCFHFTCLFVVVTSYFFFFAFFLPLGNTFEYRSRFLCRIFFHTTTAAASVELCALSQSHSQNVMIEQSRNQSHVLSCAYYVKTFVFTKRFAVFIPKWTGMQLFFIYFFSLRTIFFCNLQLIFIFNQVFWSLLYRMQWRSI